MPSAERPHLSVEDLADKTVLIVGVAREGLAVAKMLRAEVPSARLVAVDQRMSDAALAWKQQWGDDIPLVVSADGSGLPDDAEVAIVSPGLSRHNALVRGIAERGIALSSGTNLFFARHHDRIIGITGSKGKSTTSALTHHILRAHGVDAALGGNLGIPLWDVEQAEWIVAEVSSYQCHSLTQSPYTVVLTALFEEHLDWHGDFDTYAGDKLNIAGHHPSHVIVNGTQQRLVDEVTRRYPSLDLTMLDQNSRWSVRDDGVEWALTRDGKPVVSSSSLSLIGVHNGWNAALACLAAETVIPLDDATVAAALQSFTPLANRLEPVPDPSGILFLNDSLATNPPALAMALRSLRGRRVVALIGGFDRGVDDAAFKEEILSHPIAGLIGLPDSGPQWLMTIQGWFDEAGIPRSNWPVMKPVDGMVEAVRIARSIANRGDVVTLSPGAPSFGQYRDYQDRADRFIDAVNATASESE
ncbi:MAG: UDP-N-acetylmuramoyl-L-alanine--D-glutamate ligase [Pontimonas sp.]